MLTDLFPRAAARFLKLPLLGDCLDGLAESLAARGFPPLRIRRRISKAPVLETMLASEGIRTLVELTRERLLSFAPRPARMHRDLSSLVRSLAAHLADSNRLHVADPSPGELLVRSYLEFLEQVRGLAASTVRHHRRTALCLLEFLGFNDRPAALRQLSPQRNEAFVLQSAAHCGRGSLQHVASQLRSFLRFAASRGEVDSGLDAGVDTPPVGRDGHLTRALPWETVQAFLAEIDRTTPTGRRDHCIQGPQGVGPASDRRGRGGVECHSMPVKQSVV